MKLTRLIPAVLLLGCPLLSTAFSAETFEGKVTMTMTMPGSDDQSAVHTIDYAIKPGMMRIDMNDPRLRGGGMIFDYAHQQMIILIPQQRMYMIRPIPTADDAAKAAEAAGQGNPADFKMEHTSESRVILGYPCTKYVITSKDGTTEIWGTDRLGKFMGMGQSAGAGRRAQPPPAWEAALKGQDFFPLSVIGRRNGKLAFTMGVISITPGRLPDSLFAPPEGWRKFDMGGFMQGMVPGGH